MMPKYASSPKPASPKTCSATPVSSDKAFSEGLWMKRNIKPDHEQIPFKENTSISPHNGHDFPSMEPSDTMECDIVENHHVSIVPWNDGFPNNPDKAREPSTSTGPSQNKDESTAKARNQTSPGNVADPEIESQTPVRTPYLTRVSDSNAVTNLVNSWNTTKDAPAISGLSDWKEGSLPKSSIKGSMSPSSDDVSRANLEQQTGDQYIQGRREAESSSADTTVASVPGSDNRSRLLESEPEGGNGAQHPTRRAGKTITVTTSIKQVVTHNTGAVETSNIQTEIKAISPSNAGITNTASCLTPMPSGDNRATSIPSKAQIGIAQLRPLSINANNADKIELPEPYTLFISDRDDPVQGNTNPTVRRSEAIPDSYNIGQLSTHGLDTSLSNSFDQNKYYGGTDVNGCLPPIGEFISRHNTEEATAKNNTQPETGGSSSTTVEISSCSTPPLSAVGAPVAKICTFPSAETDVEAELAVEIKKPCDDSEAEDVAHICGSDPDFDLNCGTRRITKEDFVELGLHKLSWVKLSDATTSTPSMSTEDLRGYSSKDSPFLLGGANARDGSERNVKANKTGNDINDSKPVANADSLRSVEFISPIDYSGACGSQDGLGDKDAVPGSSPDRPPTKDRNEPQTYDSPRTPNVTDSGSAGRSVWVKVDINTNDLPTQLDIIEGE